MANRRVTINIIIITIDNHLICNIRKKGFAGKNVRDFFPRYA